MVKNISKVKMKTVGFFDAVSLVQHHVWPVLVTILAAAWISMFFLILIQEQTIFSASANHLSLAPLAKSAITHASGLLPTATATSS